MKSWADHCSSDEESFNEDTPIDTFDDDDDNDKAAKRPDHATVDEATEQVAETHLEEDPPQESGDNHNNHDDKPAEERKPRTYHFPSAPPYTIFVGNLSYEILDGPMLEEALAEVVKERLNQEIQVFAGKIPSLQQQGNNQRHKGFGYVEVSSVDDVSTTCMYRWERKREEPQRTRTHESFFTLSLPYSFLAAFLFPSQSMITCTKHSIARSTQRR